MSTAEPAGILKAKFNPLIRPYLVLYVGGFLILGVFTIPLAVIWFCGVGQWWARHYFDKLECELGATALRFRKGILFQVEKTIPLENIQDVTFIEGPLLKHFQLSILKFETAGQSQGQANAMRLVGIIDAHTYRTQILTRREELKLALAFGRSGSAETTPTNEHVELLRAIRSRLDEIAERLKNK